MKAPLPVTFLIICVHKTPQHYFCCDHALRIYYFHRPLRNPELLSINIFFFFFYTSGKLPISRQTSIPPAIYVGCSFHSEPPRHHPKLLYQPYFSITYAIVHDVFPVASSHLRSSLILSSARPSDFAKDSSLLFLIVSVMMRWVYDGKFIL